jgi:glucokinase, proteobacterial type
MRVSRSKQPGEIGSVQVYPCADYPGVAEVIKKYLKDTKIGRVNHAAIAIANPVDGDQVSMTNHDWSFSIEATRRALGFDTLLVVNDFTALAMALPGLTDAQRVQVGGGSRRPNSVIGLLGPAPAWAFRPDSRRRPLDRARQRRRPRTFAPADEREDIVLQYARKKWSHVSFERVAAGPGIEVIYRALAGRDKKRVAANVDTIEIVKRALEGEPLAAESVDVFCGILGTFAGNIAVTLGALGGIYIGGGVVPRLGEFFARSSFRKRFEAKGRFEAYLQNVPTYVITAEYPAFLGVSAILAEQLSNRAGGSSSAVFERIRQMRDALTPAERRVADLALNHPRSIINDPIRGYRAQGRREPADGDPLLPLAWLPGLSDFKLKLATGLTGTIPVSHSQVHLGDTATDFGAKVLDNTISAILQLREHLNFDQVERAIDLLNGARRIEFYGLGNSNIVAQDAHYKFFRFGIPTIAYGDLYMQAASAACLARVM